MTIMTPVGRVTKDLELKKGNESEYVHFGFAVNEGFGDNKKTQFYDCVAFDKVARRMIRAQVKKGSLIQVCGRFSVSEYDRNDGSGKGFTLKLTILDWDYIPGSSANKDANGVNGNDAAAVAPTTDSPPPEFAQVVTGGVIDDDDLPF